MRGDHGGGGGAKADITEMLHQERATGEQV